jgi:hypothetical protein
MTHIELPRVIDDYFAFAELPATERGRHFTITFMYMDAGKLDRLQWWWQTSKQQERSGEAQVCRDAAINRFKQHIERWLFNSQRRLTGGTPFPMLEPCAAALEPAADPVAADAPADTATDEEAAYVDSVRQFARMAVGS